MPLASFGASRLQDTYLPDERKILIDDRRFCEVNQAWLGMIQDVDSPGKQFGARIQIFSSVRASPRDRGGGTTGRAGSCVTRAVARRPRSGMTSRPDPRHGTTG